MDADKRPAPVIPHQTFLAARKVYNIQHIYLRIGDDLENILANVDFSLLDPSAGLSTDAILRLAFVSAFQYAELLPDEHASIATMKRMDWKYALCLPINFPGISVDSLCQFRQNLISSPRGVQEFSRLLDLLSEFGLFSRSANVRLDSLQVLSKVCNITRLFKLHQAMQNMLSILVAEAPDWLRENAFPHWYERYHIGRNILSVRDTLAVQVEEATTLGSDIYHLLAALRLQQPELACLAEAQYLSRLWGEQFIAQEGIIQWRLAGGTNCARLQSGICSR